MQADVFFPKLSFLQRVNFIAGILFLTSIAIRYTHADNYLPQPVIELAAIVGWMLSPIIGLVTCISIIVVIVKHKLLPSPKWLSAANILLFILQIIIYTTI